MVAAGVLDIDRQRRRHRVAIAMLNPFALIIRAVFRRKEFHARIEPVGELHQVRNRYPIFVCIERPHAKQFR